MAQVTVSGAFGMGYQKNSGAADKLAFVTSDSSIKFTASEDLGNGVKATAAVQFAANGTRGTTDGMTKEDSSVALAGGFGSVVLANSRSGNAAVSAAGISGASLADDAWGDAGRTRVSTDGVTYTTPSMSGFTVSASMLQLAADTSTATGNADANKLNAFSLQYAAGPIAAGVTLKDPKVGESTTEINASYNFGVARIAAGYVKKKDLKALTGFGISAPMGPVTLGVGYIKDSDDNTKYWDAAAVYSLSKRTSINASYGKPDQAKDNQYRVKVMHTF
jgi:predicted porin